MSYRCSRQRWSMIWSSRKRSTSRISSSPNSCSRPSYSSIACSWRPCMSSSRSTRSGSTSMTPAVGREHLLHPAQQALDVPVLDEVAGRVLLDQPLDQARDLGARGIAHVAALEDLVAVGVDHLALLVEHVVVLERVLAGEEVLLLDLALRLLDLLGEHPVLDRLLVALLVEAARGGRGSCRCARRRTAARDRPGPRGRSATRRGRPDGRSGRAAGCRSGGTRGARCRG